MQLVNRHTPYFKALILLAFSVLLLGSCELPNANQLGDAPESIDQALVDFVPKISASGIVVPIERVTLSVAFSGAVDQIFVEENEDVNEGDILLSLNGSEQMEAALAGSQLELISAEQALQDLYDNADLLAANAKEAFEDAERDYNNITTPAPQKDIDQAYADMILQAEKLETAEDNFADHDHKPIDNFVRATMQSKLSRALLRYDNAVRKYNGFSTPGNLTDIAIAEAELELARQSNEDAKDGPDPDSLTLVQARVDNAKAQVAAATAALEDIQLSAPFDGTVGQILVRENEWVVPGQPAVAMGDFSQFYVETTDLNEVDVASLQIGDGATINFDSLPGFKVGANIIQIASKSTPGEGVNYKVTLEMDEIPAGLLWDMTALVEFTISE